MRPTEERTSHKDIDTTDTLECGNGSIFPPKTK